jgi:sugar/nucleoside kinase (ribokinase family)
VELAREGHAHEHHPQSPIPFERIRRHLAADRVLINMVSGRDITLETMDEIRIAVRDRQVPIHLDMHNLTLRRSPAGALVRGPVELWRRWAFMVDTVQLNEQEIGALTIEKSDELHTAGHLLTLGPHAVIVTRGERGMSLYTNEHKRLMREDLPLEGSPAVMAGLGCGDVFGAAFVARRAAGDDPLQAARAAGAVVSQRCRDRAAATPEKA